MPWDIELTDEAKRWYLGLSATDQVKIGASIDLLTVNGPSLGRPSVDSIAGSRHHNMKELRSRGGHLRALFCFDPRRSAIVLLGGDKTDEWNDWYERNIPLADDLYDTYLQELRNEGLI